MKKLIRRINFALVSLMAMPVAALAAGNGASIDFTKSICDLALSFGGVFKALRLAAFIGAGFILAAWAWDFISKGDAKLDDAKKKGMGMLIGFMLLFLVGILLSAVLSMTGGDGTCVADAFGA